MTRFIGVILIIIEIVLFGIVIFIGGLEWLLGPEHLKDILQKNNFPLSFKQLKLFFYIIVILIIIQILREKMNGL